MTTTQPSPPTMKRRDGDRHARRRAGAFASTFAAMVALLVATALPASAWTVVGTESITSLTQGQGLATVDRPDGTTYLFYDGTLTVPQDAIDAGYDHVGDPDSSGGVIFQPFQAAGGGNGTKMFRALHQNGTHADYVHTLAPGEQMNNSWVAVTPDGQWMLAGEWGSMTRFLVFPTPQLNATTPPNGGALPLAAEVQLDHPVVDVQGCDFVSATRLLCSSDDAAAEGGFPRKPLLQVDLAAAVTGADVAGAVTAVGPLPLQSECPVAKPGSWPDDFEAEGIDYDAPTGALRVEVIPPGICGVTGTVYVYTVDGTPLPTTTTTTAPTTSSTSTTVVPSTGTGATAVTPAFTG